MDDATKRQADKLFNRLQRSPKLGSNKLDQKRSEWQEIFGAVTQAARVGGFLSVAHGNRTGFHRSRTARRVLNAAVDCGILKQFRRRSRMHRRLFKLAK